MGMKFDGRWNGEEHKALAFVTQHGAVTVSQALKAGGAVMLNALKMLTKQSRPVVRFVAGHYMVVQ